ncbi:ATP-grasp domain-containing protein [Lacicoccus alkaliphilus]|uniref:D-alanine-D-alanine ligase n=1 Tax=Lacicoccus alkaliphilus DSM 16010 TaxID=1123231 RepID=A0A1M7H6Z8_9BACL|nr:ATP-grasp domain-containing protein [Salinicoccus alkaliphilus]SHM24285.1 D-alanine-D-alanine ligase [Salinicoccus alkaliphilus DSM 16010]
MDFKQEGWLPHLIDAIPIAARKNHTSLYTIALEGWRRGLKVSFFNSKHEGGKRIGCTLYHDGNPYHFIGSSGHLITDEIIDICDDKGLTNEYLSKAHVPIPEGKEFGEAASDEEIISYSKTIDYPLVLKPTDGKAGRGVIAGIESEKELKNALNVVKNRLGYKNILLQQYVTGDEIRIYVLDGRVLAASNRRPANILGDGVSTIKNLIIQKNELRKKVPSLYFRPIKLDKEVYNNIRLQGHTMESIPKKGERVLLRKISNLSRGGESVDVLDELTEEQKNIAVRATQAIPGLVQCGVDMILNDETGSGVILELNTRPGIGNHLFPVEGTAKDIPKEIVDFYIPETKGVHTEESVVYFEFKNVLDTLKEKVVEEIEIRPYPGSLISKRMVIEGAKDVRSIYSKIEKVINAHELHGYLRVLSNSESELVLGGGTEAGVEEATARLKDITGHNGLELTAVDKYEAPVLAGFRLLDKTSEMGLADLKKEIKGIREIESVINREKARIKRRIDLMQKSHSWKLSYPIRMSVAKIKVAARRMK